MAGGSAWNRAEPQPYGISINFDLRLHGFGATSAEPYVLRLSLPLARQIPDLDVGTK